MHEIWTCEYMYMWQIILLRDTCCVFLGRCLLLSVKTSAAASTNLKPRPCPAASGRATFAVPPGARPKRALSSGLED